MLDKLIKPSQVLAVGELCVMCPVHTVTIAMLTLGIVEDTLHQYRILSDALSDQQDALLETVTT